MYKTKLFYPLALLTVLILIGCSGNQTELKIDYEKYTLENGLEVIFHNDKSDPIVSVAVLYHVGSNREVKGRTGFAHLFEHMMFQESQHVPQDQFFQKIQNAGGTLNGGTWKDGTVYYQVVPNNALEMVLWLESDRMGFLLSTVTQEAFMNQQSVVQNEKRQRYDNQPYGHTNYVLHKLLYPENHPYNWQTIGELEDLRNAKLADVHEFFKKWYGPNNATLVVAGDFEKESAKKLIEKYFGELNKGEDVSPLNPMTVVLDETRRAYHEDNFATSPELSMVYPSPQQFTKEGYALSIFSELFSQSKKSPLYKVIVEEKKLAPSVSTYQNDQEIAGEFRVRIRAFPDKSLNDVEQAVIEAFERFEVEGFTERDLDRVKAQVETAFYNQISSVLGKSFQLAYYNEFAGSPDFVSKDLQGLLDVTKEDVLKVYDKYIKGKPYVISSFVPKGSGELIADNSEKFPVVEENIEEQDVIAMQQGEQMSSDQIKVEKIESSFDRTIEPPLGPEPLISVPPVWEEELSNGITIYGIEQNELPLINFAISLRGGMLLDDIENVGVANLMTDIMMEGTRNKTPIELEESIEELGASINMYTRKESIVIEANCLSSKFGDVYDLVEEILFEPRWDEKEFERIKNETIEIINRNKANPNVVGSNVFNKIIYGPENILANSTLGTEEAVSSFTIDDMKNFYQKYFVPNLSTITIVGNISEDDAVSDFQSLDMKWEKKDVEIPEYPFPARPDVASLYFVDFPDAKQSVIMIGNLALKYIDEDFYPANVMNYKLGGNFNSYVNMILREEKGYTYGARTRFSGSLYPGYFLASSSVVSNATLESVQIFIEQMNKYREGIPEKDFEFTRNALIKSNARAFETLNALLGMLNNIAKYDLPFEYVKQREEIVRNMSIEDHQQLAKEYIDPNVMTYVVVGDAKTQLEQLKALGLGEPILVDREGNPL
ncbi:MAG: insulinase family protein [Ignavibacteriaceae bacterium]|nr:insulinase family protein [Ignavibacteriaceae bacterium]